MLAMTMTFAVIWLGLLLAGIMHIIWDRIIRPRRAWAAGYAKVREQVCTIECRSGELIVGDAIVPARGERINSVPKGAVDVYVDFIVGKYGRDVAGFEIRWNSQSSNGDEPAATMTFDIDSGVAMISDPSATVDASQAALHQARKDCLAAFPLFGKRQLTVSFSDGAGWTWGCGVTSGTGDGEYDLHIWRRDGTVTRISCTFIDADEWLTSGDCGG